MVREFKGKRPTIDKTSFVADSAELIGEVILHKDSSIWFNAVLRGDLARVEIGEGSNIQDGTVCHVDTNKPLIVGKNVTVGHNVVLHACVVGDDSLIGIGAVVLDGAEIGEECLIGAGAVVTPRAKIPPRSIALGSPARVKRELSSDEVEIIRRNSKLYIELAGDYKEDGYER